MLSLGGKQVCEVVIRTPWQLLHAHARLTTHRDKHAAENATR